MKLAVMQPYFLPYIGYFQLMAAVDKFVVFDDVNFINRGWVNRNRILVNGKDYMMTVPLKGASQNHRINEVDIANDAPWSQKLLRTIEQAYKRTAYFEEVFPVISDIIEKPEQSLAAFAANSLATVNAYLGIACEMVTTSAVYGNADLKGEERILDICRQEQASEYINLPGGKDLYNRTKFQAQGIELKFVKPDLFEYKQKADAFVPWLSILDVLMYNGKAATFDMIKAVELE